MSNEALVLVKCFWLISYGNSNGLKIDPSINLKKKRVRVELVILKKIKNKNVYKEGRMKTKCFLNQITKIVLSNS